MLFISWFEEFECLGGRCEETCCRGWVIPLDEEDCVRFKKERGRTGLSLFLATAGWTRDRFNKGSGKCPFWGRDGLCRLQKSRGHDFIPWTCRSFPRFYRNYGYFEEACLDLSCIGAARLFMKHLHELDLTSCDTEPNTKVCTTNDDRELFYFLLDQRGQLIKTVSHSLTKETAYAVISYGKKLQDDFVSGKPEAVSFDEFRTGLDIHEDIPSYFPMPARVVNEFLHTPLCHPRLKETSPALYDMLMKARGCIAGFSDDEDRWTDTVNSFLADNPLLAETLSAYYSYYLFQYFLRTYETYSFRRQLLLGLCHTNMILLLAYSDGDISRESLAMLVARYNRRAYFNDIIQDAMYHEADMIHKEGPGQEKDTGYKENKGYKIPSAGIYRRIYEMTAGAAPTDSDCGRICGRVCCHMEAFNEECYIYMLPGEELAYDFDSMGIIITKVNAAEHGFPPSWGEEAAVATCPGPDGCARDHRPIQCRTYPLLPHIDKGGRLMLVYCDAKTPYTCPLIYERTKLSEDFIESTYRMWEILIRYDAIRDFVISGSKRRRLREKNIVKR